MLISEKSWVKYIDALRKVNETAARLMSEYYTSKYDGTTEGIQALLEYAYALSTKYGEGAAELACEMYDAMAEMSGATLPPAEPAATAPFADVAKAVRGAMKHSTNADYIASSVGRMVKRAGADTTLKNAIRDGAEFAWVPHGDTCPFCMMLASNGWRTASKKALKNGHAEHIHTNCDCTYAIRFDGKSTVSGYDPERYAEMYRNAEGSTPSEKVNAMRRMQYVQNKDAINAQKRAAFHERKLQAHRGRGFDVLKEYFEDAEPGKGFLDYDANYDKENRSNEIRAAQLIHRVFGGDILLKSEKYGQKNPDYEWMGRFWDLKTTTTEKSANSAIKSGMKQIASNPGGIILNFEDNEFSMDELRKVIDLRMQWYPAESADILIISKGKPLCVLRY